MCWPCGIEYESVNAFLHRRTLAVHVWRYIVLLLSTSGFPSCFRGQLFRQECLLDKMSSNTVARDVTVEDVVRLTQVLTQINSSNPNLSVSGGSGETEIADYICAWLAHRNIEFHRVEPVPGRPSVVGVLRGSGGGRSLMFNGHVDTVSLSAYEDDPLSGILGIKHDKQVVFGRGCLDMKGGIAAALVAMSAIKAGGHGHRGDIIVAAVCDEEYESQGTQDLINAGWRADAAVIGEPTMNALVTAHKGVVWVEIDVLGVAAHGSDPSKGQDAIIHMGWLLSDLEEYQLTLPVDDVLGQATMHCGLIRGGEEMSSYPGRCTVTLEFRSIPAQSDESILNDVKALLQRVSLKNPPFKYDEPRVTFSRPITKIPIDHPIVQEAVQSATHVFGTAPAIETVPFWCDAALLNPAGIPSIVFGPSGAGLHGKEEWVEVESLRQVMMTYKLLAENFCA